MTYDRFRTLDDSRFDVIVVGAGLGGLTAAALLTRQGKKVLVVDQHAVAGGNATIFKRSGYEFDVGLHYIGGCQPDGPIPRILKAAGADDVEFAELDANGFDTLVFPDFEFQVPKGIDRYRARLLEFFPREGRGVDRYVKLLHQIRAVQQSRVKPTSALWTLPRSFLLARWAGRTFKEFLDSCTEDVRLQAVIAGQHGDYALPPSRASVLLGAGLALHYLEGAYYPRGGGQVISDHLATAIEQQGGKILLMARVERILTANGRVQGVDLCSQQVGRRIVHAPAVISNADLKRTFLELLGKEDLPAGITQRVRDFEMAPALGMLYLGYDRNLREEGHPVTNYWIYPDYDFEPQYAQVHRGQFPADPFAYVSIASLKDPTNPRLAPPGVTNLQVMSLAPSQPQSWGVTAAAAESKGYRKSAEYQRLKEAFGDRLIRTAARVFPDLPDRLVFQELATPLTQTRYTGSTDGTSYGIAGTPQQFLRHRPGIRTDIQGLYICGASTRMGHGIGGVTMSGLFAAATLVGRDLVQQTLGPANQTASVLAR
jgi:phytoene dehydrogenase-like protein